MIDFPNNLPAFFCTEFISYEKPLILRTADYFLAPLRVQTPFERTSIGHEGFHRGDVQLNKGYFDGVFKVLLITSCFALAGSPKMKAVVAAPWLSGVFMATSLAINGAKNLNTYFFKKIDERGDFFGSKLLKGMTLVVSASLPIFVGSFGLLGLYINSGVSLPVISLIAFSCLALQLSAGALLKVIAYNTNPKIKSAYDNYCKKNTDNSAITLSKPENEIPYNSNIIEQSFEKLENKETLGLLNDLNSDVTGLILSSYLPIEDLIQFRTINKKLSEVFSTRTICIRRIQESFSTDFINKLGLEHILNAMENEPLNPLVVFGPHDVQIPLEEQINRNLDRLHNFTQHMQKNPIAWGHETPQNPKIKSKLFLIFDDVNKQSIIRGDSEKYYMIASHDNSKLTWEQRSIKRIKRERDYVLQAIPIYKVDEDRRSTVPLSELKAEDYDDDTIVRKTDFFKNFKNPEALVQI